MAATAEIPGYAYGRVDRSPVSLGELEDLERAVGFGPPDEEALRALWSVIDGHLERLFETWMGRIAHFFVPTFAGPGGQPDERYMAAAHPRFLRWIEDTCTRRYDREWLDYQQEIALRHHRSKKNRTDAVDAAPVVPFRYLPVAIQPMTLALRDFLRDLGVERDAADRMAEAWAKSLTLQVALWSRAYVADADW